MKLKKTNNITKFGLPITQLEILYKILEGYAKVEKVMIFGSRSKNSFNRLSDLDLVIVGSGQNKVNAILGDIDDSDFLWKVDIIGYDQIEGNQLLKSEIDKYAQDFWTR